MTRPAETTTGPPVRAWDADRHFRRRPRAAVGGLGLVALPAVAFRMGLELNGEH